MDDEEEEAEVDERGEDGGADGGVVGSSPCPAELVLIIDSLVEFLLTGFE